VTCWPRSNDAIVQAGDITVIKREIKISIKAVFAGGAVDVLGSIILISLLCTYVAIANGMSEGRPEVIAPMIRNIIHKSPLLFAIQTTMGLLCSILGGYVAARTAGEDEVENAIAASLIFVVFGIYALVAGGEDAVWLNAFSTIITPFFYRLGAQARMAQIKRK